MGSFGITLAVPERHEMGQVTMTIVIQDIGSRRFYEDNNHWVTEPRDAVTFTDTRHALRFCRRHHLRNVRLVVFFSDRKVSLLLYVPGSDTPAPAGEMHAAEFTGPA